MGSCPILGQHLLDPSPKFDGLRGFAMVIDSALERVDRAPLSEQAIEAFESRQLP